MARPVSRAARRNARRRKEIAVPSAPSMGGSADVSAPPSPELWPRPRDAAMDASVPLSVSDPDHLHSNLFGGVDSEKSHLVGGASVRNLAASEPRPRTPGIGAHHFGALGTITVVHIRGRVKSDFGPNIVQSSPPRQPCQSARRIAERAGPYGSKVAFLAYE